MSALKERDMYHLRLTLIDYQGKEIDGFDYPPSDWVELQERYSRMKLREEKARARRKEAKRLNE